MNATKELRELYTSFTKSPEASWIMSWSNAVDLYNFITQNPIKKVLGLGTGVGLSDAVIALAWKDKGEKEGKLITVEQYDKCIKLAKELIPKELQSYIEFFKTEPTIWANDKIPYLYFSIYKDLPEGEFDLIVNDGPGPFVDKNGYYVDLPNGTVHKLTLEDRIKPGTYIIYDGRISSINLLERYFDKCYYLCKVSKIGSDFFLLQRKSSPVEVSDVKYESMKNQTKYFNNHEQKNPVSCHKSCPSCETKVVTPGTEK